MANKERESKKMPGTKAKIIRIYADNKFVNHEWLARQKELELNFNKPTTEADEPAVTISDVKEEDTLDESTMDKMFKAPANATAVSGAMPTAEAKPKNEALDAIRNLAKTKGLTNESMSETEADAVIEKYTGLKMIEENLTKVIIALTGYSAKK
jgi:hypothetical protein